MTDIMFGADYQHKLVSLIKESLEEVAPSLCGRSGWADIIGDAIRRRMKEFDSRIECGYGRGKPQDEGEWIFDFSAVFCEPNDTKRERYLMQAVIVGEIECHGGLNKDFEKLLIADSLVSFFVFPDSATDHPGEDELEFFYDIARKRCGWAALRGMKISPAFIIARRCSQTGSFSFRVA